MVYEFAPEYEECLREIGWNLSRDGSIITLEGRLADLARHPAYSKPIPTQVENMSVRIVVKPGEANGVYAVDCLIRTSKKAQFFFYQRCGDRFNSQGLPSVENFLANIDSELLGQKSVSFAVARKHEENVAHDAA